MKRFLITGLLLISGRIRGEPRDSIQDTARRQPY